MKLLTILVLCAVAIGCGYGSSYKNGTMTGGGNSLPTISQLSPSSMAHGSAGFSLTITGTNFDAGSIVYWGTTALMAGTAYNSTTQLTASISSSMIATSGSVSIYVHTSAGNSNSMMFTIN